MPCPVATLSLLAIAFSALILLWQDERYRWLWIVGLVLFVLPWILYYQVDGYRTPSVRHLGEVFTVWPLIAVLRIYFLCYIELRQLPFMAELRSFFGSYGRVIALDPTSIVLKEIIIALVVLAIAGVISVPWWDWVLLSIALAFRLDAARQKTGLTFVQRNFGFVRFIAPARAIFLGLGFLAQKILRGVGQVHERLFESSVFPFPLLRKRREENLIQLIKGASAVA